MEINSGGSEEFEVEEHGFEEETIQATESEIFSLLESPDAKRKRVATFKKKNFEFDTSDSTLRQAAVNTFYQDEIKVEVSLKEFERKDGKDAHKSHLCLRKVKRTATSFTCLDCGMNQNAMICGECYDVRRHIGHRVMKVNRPGICDCGDINMWKKEGNCSKHTGN